MRTRIIFRKLGKLKQLKWRITATLYGYLQKASRANIPDYDIGVTTYIARFETYFKSIIYQLSYLFPDRRIIVVANGHYESDKQTAYLKNLRKFLNGFPNVTLICYQNPSGLAKMWNDVIKASRLQSLLMLNDDIYLLPTFRSEMESSNLFDNKIVKINGSWSHFLITRQIIDAVGWFDEDFVEIGHEDADYEARLACRGISINNLEMHGVCNCSEEPKEYSYGKQLEVADGKYSGKNRQYFYSKWDSSDIEKPGYKFLPMIGKWVKLRDNINL